MGLLLIEGVVFVAASVAITVIVLLWSRPLIARWVADEHNTVVGALFAAAGVVYAVVLAFVVFVVWAQWGAADSSIVAEAASMVSAYRATEVLPQPQQKQAQDGLRAFANNEIETEWSRTATLKPHTTADNLNPVWAAFRTFQPTDPMPVAAEQDAIGRMSDLEEKQHMVHLAGEGTLPDVFWLVLLVGAVGTVAFSYVMAMENARVHAVASGALAAMLAILLFLVYALNFPFSGAVHVSQQPIQHALLMFDEIDRH